MLLCDQGYWEPIGDPGSSYRHGRLKFVLHGEKLQDMWNLVRMGGRQEAGKENWLLIKERDAEVRKGKESQVTECLTQSVASGRSMEEIASGDHVVRQSGQSSAKGKRAATNRRPVNRRPAPGARKAPQEEWIVPQPATLVSTPPAAEEWVHELKYDGYHILCLVKGDGVTLLTRNGHDGTAKLPHIASAVSALPINSALAGWRSRGAPAGRPFQISGVTERV